MSRSTTLQGDLKVEIIAENGGYSAFCSDLNLASQGDTIEEALEMFKECLSIFLEDLIENGNLEKVLLESGWQVEMENENSAIKVIIPSRTFQTSVPLNNFLHA